MKPDLIEVIETARKRLAVRLTEEQIREIEEVATEHILTNLKRLEEGYAMIMHSNNFFQVAPQVPQVYIKEIVIDFCDRAGYSCDVMMRFTHIKRKI